MPLSPHEIYEAHRQKFDLYEKLLLKWNQKINLTAITDTEEIRALHFEDSLAGVAVIKGFFKNVPRGTFYSGGDPALPPNPPSGKSGSDRELRLDGLAKPDPSNTRSLWHVLDIGSGNGLPGLAIKIVLPEVRLTLVDSVKKKCDFIKEVVRQLHLKDVDVQHRFLTPKDKIGAFDVVVSRAAFDLSEFIEIAAPHVHSDGLLVTWKSQDLQHEITAAESVREARGFEKFERLKYELEIKGKRWSRELIFCRKLI